MGLCLQMPSPSILEELPEEEVWVDFDFGMAFSPAATSSSLKFFCFIISHIPKTQAAPRHPPQMHTYLNDWQL